MKFAGFRRFKKKDFEFYLPRYYRVAKLVLFKKKAKKKNLFHQLFIINFYLNCLVQTSIFIILLKTPI